MCSMEILNPGTVGDTKHIESPRAATLGLSLYFIANYLLFNAACAAARRAIGTRNGEQET